MFPNIRFALKTVIKCRFKGFLKQDRIAVEESFSRAGIGSYMINKLIDNYNLHFVFAETDDEAVEFYRKNGFKITKFTEIYGDKTVIRYSCNIKF